MHYHRFRRHAAITIAALIMLAACQPATDVSPTPAPIPTPSGDPIPDEEALALMDALTIRDSQNPGAGDHALQRILAAGDTRFIAVLIELLRFQQIGIPITVSYHDVGDALDELSGQDFGIRWALWIEWYGTTDLTPPPSFTGWKGETLAVIDPGFGEFLRDDAPSLIRTEEVQWGGVLVDAIPALDNPTMVAAEAATYLTPQEPVFGLSINGDSRAYPLRIMDWHEMSNDVIGGVPVSLSYCTLCGAAIAYDGRASDGVTYTFGSSGFLYRSNKLMYDRQTRTLWNQLTGQPVLGELAGQDVTLPILPVVLSRWDEWLADHPDTVVLDVNTGYNRPYELGAAYGDYFGSEGTMFPVWQRSDLLPDKSRIYALTINGVPKAYPLDALAEEVVVNDELADTPLVLITPEGRIYVNETNRNVGAISYDSGGEVRAYQRGDHTFAPGPDDSTVLDENGAEWTITEDALIGPDEESLERLPGHLAYWFGWYAFFPQTAIYGIEE